MRAIVNASPLIFLSKLDKVELLNELFATVTTTSEVREEVLDGLNHGYTDALIVKKKIEKNEIAVVKPTKKREWCGLDNLGYGERSILFAALNPVNKIDIVIMDDAAGIKTARYFGLDVISTPFVLLRALKNKRLTHDEFCDALDKLVQKFDYRISPVLYMKIIECTSSFTP